MTPMSVSSLHDSQAPGNACNPQLLHLSKIPAQVIQLLLQQLGPQPERNVELVQARLHWVLHVSIESYRLLWHLQRSRGPGQDGDRWVRHSMLIEFVPSRRCDFLPLLMLQGLLPLLLLVVVLLLMLPQGLLLLLLMLLLLPLLLHKRHTPRRIALLLWSPGKPWSK